MHGVTHGGMYWCLVNYYMMYYILVEMHAVYVRLLTSIGVFYYGGL